MTKQKVPCSGSIGWLIDKYILENKELQEAITAIMDRMKELITPFEEWIEEEHRKDLEAGIRMD